MPGKNSTFKSCYNLKEETPRAAQPRADFITQKMVNEKRSKGIVREYTVGNKQKLKLEKAEG